MFCGHSWIIRSVAQIIIAIIADNYPFLGRIGSTDRVSSD